MTIQSLARIPVTAILEAFAKAFADYDVQISEMQFLSMLKRRGFSPELSFAAFEGGEIVSFTLNGIGNYAGIPTAYDTGTGTLPAYRRQGLAPQIFEYSIPYLREEGIRQYLLEVLQHNSKAIPVYTKLGFEVTREFNCFVQETRKVVMRAHDHTDFTIREAGSFDSDVVSGFWDFIPSWQNSFDSVRRAADDFITIGAFHRQKLIGYCIFEPASGDITQIAVDKAFRRRGVGSLLLSKAIALNTYETVKVINTDVSCESVTGFLESANIPLKRKQFEMVKNL